LAFPQKYSDCADSWVAQIDFATLWKCLSLLPELLQLRPNGCAKVWHLAWSTDDRLANSAL
jgi:hypothetical protein